LGWNSGQFVLNSGQYITNLSQCLVSRYGLDLTAKTLEEHGKPLPHRPVCVPVGHSPTFIDQ
jgi:hypothetical protein